MGRRKKAATGQGSPAATGRRGLPGLSLLMPVVGLLAVAGFALSTLLSRGGGENDVPSVADWPPPGPRTAAIVDQLELTYPNPEFVESATASLSRVGFDVDYYAGEEVTVDLYRDLPALDYDLVILRVHSGRVKADSGGEEERLEDYVSLFTGEPYSPKKYVQEQRERRLSSAFYYDGAEPLFGIPPDFVRHSMNGEFEGTVVVMMGCDGLHSNDTAEAFLERGASAYASWDLPVSAEHTDGATELLLEGLVGGLGVEEAVGRASLKMGPDPAFGSELYVVTDR